MFANMLLHFFMFSLVYSFMLHPNLWYKVPFTYVRCDFFVLLLSKDSFVQFWFCLFKKNQTHPLPNIPSTHTTTPNPQKFHLKQQTHILPQVSEHSPIYDYGFSSPIPVPRYPSVLCYATSFFPLKVTAIIPCLHFSPPRNCLSHK